MTLSVTFVGVVYRPPSSHRRASGTPQSSSHRAACERRASTRSTSGSSTREFSADLHLPRVCDTCASSAPAGDVAPRAWRVLFRIPRGPRESRYIYMRCSRRPSLLSRRIFRTDLQALSGAEQTPVVSAESTQPALTRTYAWGRTVKHPRPQTRTSDARGFSRSHARLALQPAHHAPCLATSFRRIHSARRSCAFRPSAQRAGLTAVERDFVWQYRDSALSTARMARI
jgi:hypothetical protein